MPQHTRFRHGVIAAVAAAGVAVVAWASVVSAASPGAASSAKSTSGSSPTTTAATVTKTRSVLLVGDSLLTGAIVDVETALVAQRWAPTVAAWPGTTIEEWIARVPELVASSQPDAVVIELGTNDCNDACTGIDAAIDGLLRELPADIPVYWLNVQEEPFWPANAEAVNAGLENASQRWADLTIVDMDSRFRGHAEWHVADGLHFNADGNTQLAGLIAGAVEEARGSAPR
jgi:lysophospholipase L1-like esterase